MSTDERIQKAIDEHQRMLEELESKAPWYRNSTRGQEIKRLCEYTLNVLENIQKGE